MSSLVSRKKKALYRAALRIQFQDEAPRLGSGWRTVIPTIGRKWVRIVEVSTGRGARLKRATWDCMTR